MRTIRFSHYYAKLWEQETATLIGTRILDAKEVQKNVPLIHYDTQWEDKNTGDTGWYPLPPSGKLIQLIFIGNKEIPFCTLRRYTEEKFQYYSKSINNTFNIIINQDEK